jgi:hypothetical protein
LEFEIKILKKKIEKVDFCMANFEVIVDEVMS